VIAFSAAITVIIVGKHVLFMIKDKIVRGPSFCQVLKIMQLVHEMDDITDGNQKWHGAIPILSISAAIIMYDGGIVNRVDHKDDEAIKMMLEPNA
jgi:hypothetical protein